MSEPDEALLWARWSAYQRALEMLDGDETEALAQLEHEDALYVIDWLATTYRAGAAASAERIKALEARVAELENELEEGSICQPTVSKSDEPQTSDRASLEALILVVERDGHDGSHLEDDDGQNECPVCATVTAIRALLMEPDQ